MKLNTRIVESGKGNTKPREVVGFFVIVVTFLALTGPGVISARAADNIATFNVTATGTCSAGCPGEVVPISGTFTIDLTTGMALSGTMSMTDSTVLASSPLSLPFNSQSQIFSHVYLLFRDPGGTGASSSVELIFPFSSFPSTYSGGPFCTSVNFCGTTSGASIGPLDASSILFAATGGNGASIVISDGSVVPAVTGFTGSISPKQVSVASGGSARYAIGLTPVAGFTGDVALSITGLPAGASAAFSPGTITGGTGSSTLTVSTSSATPTGSYILLVTGTSGNATHSDTIQLAVNAPTGDFTGSISPVAQSVNSGSSTSYTVNVAPEFGFTGDVALTASGLPIGANATFNPATIVGGSGSSTLTVSTTAGQVGTALYVVTVTGTSGALVHNDTIQLAVNSPTGDFGLTALPTQPIYPGSSTYYKVALTPLFGFTGSVTLVVGGLPSGATSNFNPMVVPGGLGVSALKVTAAAGTPADTFGLSVTAIADSGLSHSTGISLPVTDFTGSISPGGQTVAPGGVGRYTINFVPLNGFGGNVGLSVSGLPFGASASFSPSALSAGTPTSTLTVSTSASTPIGTYGVLVTASNGILAHSDGVRLSVNMATGDFTGSITPGSQTVSASGGGSVAYTINLVPLDGFTGNVALTVSGVPAGTTATFTPSTIVGGSGSSTLTVKPSPSTPPGTYELIVTGTSGTLSHSDGVPLIVSP